MTKQIGESSNFTEGSSQGSGFHHEIEQKEKSVAIELTNAYTT